MLSQWRARIESDPLILHGKPCFKDTRIPVSLILGYLASGADTEAVISQFPDLSSRDITAALDYARDLADFEAAPT